MSTSEGHSSGSANSAPAPFPTISPTSAFTPSVSQLGNPVSVASDVLLVINGHHVAVNQSLAAYYNRRKSWLARIFPTALDRVIMDGQLRQATTECELNERLLKLAVDMKYESCREVGEAWVRSLKVGVRQQFTAFVTEQYETMGRKIEEKRVNFSHDMRERYRTLEACRDMPEYAARYKVSLDREIERHFEWLDQLLEGFRSVIDEKVGEYSPGR